MQIDLINGDSFDEMPLIPDESFHLIFVDPPYKLSNDGFSCQSGKRVSVNKGFWDKSNGFKEDFDFHLRWINECKRLLKPNGTIFIGTLSSGIMEGRRETNHWYLSPRNGHVCMHSNKSLDELFFSR
jgi:23S rRNA G2069 N7-methylase RlmK/C1962 C5-methylase RlmI